MDFILLVFSSFALLADPVILTYVILGFVIGTIFAAIPGLTATLAMALLLPLTYTLNVETALMACASIYMAGMCGGSITATTINIPGAPSSMMTALDGYPMQQQGKGALALGHAALGSMFGGALGAILLIALAPFVAEVSLLVKTTGKFSLLAFAIIVVVIAQRGKIAQAGLAACIGLMLATVGLDAMEPITRFTYGNSNLTAGIDLMPVIIGTFAIAEVLIQACSNRDISAAAAAAEKVKIRRRDFLPPISDIRRIGLGCYIKSSLIGYFVGTLPGAGGSMGSFLAYTEAMRTSSEPESFGKGNPQGIAASESANNAVCGGAMVPMLTFGIPGDPITAIMLGVLVINGIQPGPQLMSDQAGLIAPMLAALLFSAVVLIPLTLYLIGPYFIKIVSIRKDVLYAVISLLAVVGSYVATYSTFQMFMALGMGVLAFYLRRNGLPVITMLLGYILGPNLEEFLRRSLALSNGNPMTFFTNLDSLFFIVLTMVFVYFLVIRKPAEKPVRIKGE
ncbi:tricarboxylate transporter [Pacificitalea manganoxidans]|uniref:Tricarboxylate transporter n=1 Tax=Pacificitalea manganoxidans TaxID=1411902 RepID=A0A291LVE3_9RHOB|nr:tripartite tricarboxylate transporter permease [Pacificitalea manganoxidans]ATI40624.1 tricarboxylate transporter [Pacificitalea manganoxidans]MDR6309611.1 putative tricarboxylic transport membrane protein [Pacificitalea manganoxidans]OWU69736.1 tricarboxylate transporter [Roseovarius sp. 22II1-1F6A]|tara:strand:+ start:1622 stop:3148 length:1527 start_codon:yes stop_codon:yes gene_type:complete